MPKTPTLPTSAFPELQIKTITRKTNQNLDKPRQRHQHSHTNKRADLTAPKKPKTDPFQMKKKTAHDEPGKRGDRTRSPATTNLLGRSKVGCVLAVGDEEEEERWRVVLGRRRRVLGGSGII